MWHMTGCYKCNRSETNEYAIRVEVEQAMDKEICHEDQSDIQFSSGVQVILLGCSLLAIMRTFLSIIGE